MAVTGTSIDMLLDDHTDRQHVVLRDDLWMALLA
jgi:hypothetical protein